MDDVVTGNMLREHRRSSGAIDAFGRIDIFHCAQQSLLPSVQAGCIAATLLELPARFDQVTTTCR